MGGGGSPFRFQGAGAERKHIDCLLLRLHYIHRGHVEGEVRAFRVLIDVDSVSGVWYASRRSR